MCAVVINSSLHGSRNRKFVVQVNDLFCAFYDPGKNAFSGILIQVVAVVLDVALSLDLGIERDDDQAAPGTVIGCTDLRQMVGVKRQAVAGRKAERVFVLFLREDVIGGAELLDGGIVQPSVFLHRGGDEQTLAFDLRHLRLHIPAASEGQCVSGDVTAVQTQDSGDGVPEGRLAVAATAVCDDKRFDLNLGRNSCGLGDEVLRGMLPGTGYAQTEVIGGIRGAEQEGSCIQILRRDFQHRAGLFHCGGDILGRTALNDIGLCLCGQERLICFQLFIAHRFPVRRKP